MSVTSIEKDVDRHTLTLTADFQAPVDQVWQLWADPRLLERWWGPPTYPATVKRHELVPGGGVSYFMTGPGGDRHHGWWRIASVNPPTSMEFSDGFADQDGVPLDDMPAASVRLRLSERQGGTRMELQWTYASAEGLEKVLSMGMEEGLRLAVGQMDALLTAV